MRLKIQDNILLLLQNEPDLAKTIAVGNEYSFQYLAIPQADANQCMVAIILSSKGSFVWKIEAIVSGERNPHEESFRKKACEALTNTVAAHLAKKLDSVSSFTEFDVANQGSTGPVGGSSPPRYEDVNTVMRQEAGPKRS